MPDPLPFLEKKYYIYESIKGTCPTSIISRITTSNAYPSSYNNGNSKQSGPFTMIDIEEYMLNEIQLFMTDMNNVLRCDKFVANAPTQIPKECYDTFSSFTTPPNAPYTGIKFQTNDINTISQNLNQFYKFKNASSSKKELCQRIVDINQMLSDITNLIGAIPQNTVVADKYSIILEKHNNLLKLRSDLDVKIKELTDEPSTFSYENKTHLDSTIITGIMWSILATSMVYYVFVKM